MNAFDLWQKLETIQKRHRSCPWKKQQQQQHSLSSQIRTGTSAGTQGHGSPTPESDHSLALKPWSQSVLTFCTRVSDIDSYPQRPTGPRPPTFLHGVRNGIHWKAHIFCQCRPRLAPNQWLEGEGKSFRVSFSAVIPSYTYGIYSLQV